MNIPCFKLGFSFLYLNLIFIIQLIGMIFSMCGLMMKLKWCAWIALYCSCISFANSRATDDAKQVINGIIEIIAYKLFKSFIGFIFVHVER